MNFAPECTFAWDGAAASIFVFAIPLAILATTLTIFLYRKSVERAMRFSAGERVAVSLETGESAAPKPLKIAVVADADDEMTPQMLQSRSEMRNLSGVYVLAGLVQSAVVVLLYFVLNDIEFKPLRTFMVWLPYAWPIILTLTLTATTTRRQKYSLIAGYFIVLLLLDAGAEVLNLRYQPGFGELFLLWAIIMGLPTLVVALLSNRAWRPVGLIALFLGIALSGSYLLGFQGLGCLVLSTRNVTLLHSVNYLLAALVLLFFALAWWGLRRLVWRYRAKRYSDQMLVVDSWWLLVTLFEMLFQMGTVGVLSLSYLLAFIAYKAVTRIGLRRLRTTQTMQQTTDVPSAMLMLRVFGYSARTRQLTDQVGQYWRYSGPINMIGGADLATALIEPDELMQFWSGKLRQTFIASEADLNARLQTLDTGRDPDARYRINEFFCHDNTWQATVKALAQRSAVVLMDLRGFGKANRGCEFELAMLLGEVPITRVLLLVDRTTRLDELEPVLQTAWRTISDASPNRALAEPVLHLFQVADSDHALRPLLSRLFACATRV
jgi:hypothetical protein